MKGGWFKGDIFMIGPASFVNKVNKNPIFNSYYQAFFVRKIDKSNFYPPPKTVSAIIYLRRIDYSEKTKNISIFIKRFLYEHEGWKLKNCLREAIIKSFYKIKNKLISKNQARQIIKKLKINPLNLEKKVYEVELEFYNNIAEEIKLINI